MNIVDKTFLRLANSDTRSSVFDEIALEQILEAAYDTDALAITGPYVPIFDKLSLGFTHDQSANINGQWKPLNSAEYTQGDFNITGLGQSRALNGHCLWIGSIRANIIPGDGTIIRADVAWPTVGDIDKEIIDDLGGFPADNTSLENERRVRLLERIKANMDQPLAFSDQSLSAWLKEIGVSSVNEYVDKYKGVTQLGTVQVEFSPPASNIPIPKVLPITAVILIRDKDFSVTDLLLESKQILNGLKKSGYEQPIDSSLYGKRSQLVIWVIPEAVFDDSDWPGGESTSNPNEQRKLRRIKAGKILALEGVGLVTVK